MKFALLAASLCMACAIELSAMNVVFDGVVYEDAALSVQSGKKVQISFGEQVVFGGIEKLDESTRKALSIKELSAGGRLYKNIMVMQVDPVGISIMLPNGVSYFKFETLDSATQALFSYSKEQAVRFSSAKRAKVRLIVEARAAKTAKERDSLAASLEDSKRRFDEVSAKVKVLRDKIEKIEALAPRDATISTSGRISGSFSSSYADFDSQTFSGHIDAQSSVTSSLNPDAKRIVDSYASEMSSLEFEKSDLDNMSRSLHAHISELEESLKADMKTLADLKREDAEGEASLGK